MQCDRNERLLSPYLDGELGPEEHREVSAHLRQCPTCERVAEDFRVIGRTISERGRVTVPNGLAARISHKLTDAAEPSERQGWPRLVPSRLRHFQIDRGSLLRQAAVILVACVISSLLTWSLVSKQDQIAQLEQQVISAHVRSLVADSPIQVASSDSHTVKPWFNGKVDFSPDVKDLSAEGFPLLGGRLDYVAGRRVGVLVYKHRFHTINIFAWASGNDSEPLRSLSRDGFNMLTWKRNGISYVAVSDLNSGDLKQLQSLL